MRLLLAILFFSFALFIEMLLFPWIEHSLGREIFPHGLGTIVLPLISGFIGWVFGDLLIRQARRSSKYHTKKLTSRGKLYLGAAIIWETLALFYILISKSLVANASPLEWSTYIFLIVFPPLVMVFVYLLIVAIKKTQYFKTNRFNETLTYFKENLNTFPVLLQILAALSLLVTMMNLPGNYQNFLTIFVFVSAVISTWDAYKSEEFHFATIFILIACLYNPIYPMIFDKQIWLILNMMVAFLFTYKVSLIWITEQNLEKNLKKIAKKIDVILKEFDKNTSDYTAEMLEKYIKSKHTYVLSIKSPTVEWREKSLPHFTFSSIEVFNGENAICVSGKETFAGFHVLLLFYNQTFKFMIFLDLNATITAKRLKRVMTQDFGYIEYNRNLPGEQ